VADQHRVLADGAERERLEEAPVGRGEVFARPIRGESGGVIEVLAVISAGRMLVEGSPDEVMASPEVQRVYLGIDVQ